jgi:hypothetical protein
MKKVIFSLTCIFILLPIWSWGASVSLSPLGDITTWPGTPFRWLDIADFPYSSTYQSSYTYAQANVTLNYDSSDVTFSGTLTATGLKPNFAYQIKLVGFGSNSSDPQKFWTNEQLGYAGRWWRAQPDPGNSTDADYEANKDDPDSLYQGYLLFAYFVTDGQGSATVPFSANSSFHVLWATPDSTNPGTGHRTPGVNDGPVTDYSFTASPAVNPSAYAIDYGVATVGIYGEWQSTRALPGELILSPGTYLCQFILTEESFHQSGLGGGWASAMGAEAQFEVVPVPPSVLLFSTGLLGLGLLGRRRKRG